MRAHVRFLSANELEGRGVGTRAEVLATSYIATQFQLAGAVPAGQAGTFYQMVPLAGVRTRRTASLTAVRRGVQLSFAWLEDFVGNNRRQTARERVEAEAVFAGYGIVAPEFDWDDYKNVDVAGKVVLVFAGEPPSDDPKRFAAEALTRYSHWSYKFEQALRKGAVAALLIHTAPTAGYGWQTVQASWSAEEPYFRLPAGTRELAFAGWISEQAAAQLVRPASVDQFLDDAKSRSFRPLSLGWQMRLDIPTDVWQFESRNVVAMFPGSEIPSEAVVFTAHWNHLGLGMEIEGDSVYNGAIDNATGCAMLMELARAWGALPSRPRRSVIFLSPTSEEGHMQGTEYYVSHPVVPPGRTVAAFNFDALAPIPRALDVIAAGAERTTLWPLVEQVARRFRLEASVGLEGITAGPFRSDQHSFAKAGIPAVALQNGTRLVGRHPDPGMELTRGQTWQHYHLPSDEYRENWDFAGLEQLALYSLALGLDAANMSALPTWNKEEEYLPVRQKSFDEAAGPARRAR